MRAKMHQLLHENIFNNSRNSIVYYEGNERKVKSFIDLGNDVQMLLERLNYLRVENNVETVAILGYISYDWMLADLGCIKGGFKSIAIPESFSCELVQNIINETNSDILLLDYRLANIFSNLKIRRGVYLISDPAKTGQSVHNIPTLIAGNKQEIRQPYGICYSSGTSEKVKAINLNFLDNPVKKGFINKIYGLHRYIKYKLSFWSRKDNKVIIFMPLSHFQQRLFIFQALLLNIDIVLSDSKNCLKHLIMEKPNIMVSVPVFYEVMSQRLKLKLDRFSKHQKQLFKWFTLLGINRLSNRNLLKRAFTSVVFKDITKIYGGRADYFVTGSAPINPDVIRLFYSIGVKIYEAYGQSETQIISMNTERNFRVGSVGKPFTKIKIGPDSEIMVKYNEDKHHYNKSILNVNEDGYINTGDLGYLDNDGYLFLKGRKDDVIVLNNGKKIYPTEIESTILKFDLISHALVFLNGNETISVIISPTSVTPAVKEILNIIRGWNKAAPYYCRITELIIAQVPFSYEDGLLTSTLKMKRKLIIEKYSKEKFISITETDDY